MPYRTRSDQQARSHQRLPVFVGAVSLAMVSGYVNVVVLGFFHVPVSHMSGAVSRLSIDLATMDFVDLALVLSIIGGFLGGSVISGMVIGGRGFVPGRRYGVTLLIEGGLLAVAVVLLKDGVSLGVPVAAMACGVQNAMASSYYGLVIRTTHVTRIVTDVGVMLGHWLRHRRIRVWKFLLLSSILIGFFVGGIIGALAHRLIGVSALALASAGCITAGTIYYAWYHRRARAR